MLTFQNRNFTDPTIFIGCIEFKSKYIGGIGFKIFTDTVIQSLGLWPK